MFGYKAESKFGKAVWYVFITCATIIALALVVDIYDAVHLRVKKWSYYAKTQRSDYLHDYSNQYVSPYVIFHDDYPGYLFNTTTGQRTLTGIHWVCKSSDNDSLACFSTIEERKRGYFNRFTGEVAIPAQYDRAWIFSEGMACVMQKGTLSFIGHDGKAAMSQTFPYTPCIDDYCFHNGLCVMQGDDGGIGIINRDGEWAVEPIFSHVHYESKGFWLIQDEEGRQGLLDAFGTVFLPCEYDEITVRFSNFISVRTQDHVDQLYDFEGNLVNTCDYREIETMEYVTNEYTEYGEVLKKMANCRKYRSSDYRYGLMDSKGNLITPPLYDHITAIAADLYHCEGDEGSILLDGKGNECGEKL